MPVRGKELDFIMMFDKIWQRFRQKQSKNEALVEIKSWRGKIILDADVHSFNEIVGLVGRREVRSIGTGKIILGTGGGLRLVPPGFVDSALNKQCTCSFFGVD